MPLELMRGSVQYEVVPRGSIVRRSSGPSGWLRGVYAKTGWEYGGDYFCMNGTKLN